MCLVVYLDPKVAVEDVDALVGLLVDVEAWPPAGTSNSSTETLPDDSSLRTLNVTRPADGVGRSLPWPGATLNGWAVPLIGSDLPVSVVRPRD